MNKHWSYGKFSRTRYNKISDMVVEEMSYMPYFVWIECFGMFIQSDVIWDEIWNHMMRKLSVEARIVQW